jgi:hypothetical protein
MAASAPDERNGLEGLAIARDDGIGACAREVSMAGACMTVARPAEHHLAYFNPGIGATQCCEPL